MGRQSNFYPLLHSTVSYAYSKEREKQYDFYANDMQSHNTCHAEHKYDVAYDVLEKNIFSFFSESVQTVIVMKLCLPIQDQNAEQCFPGKF